MRTQIVAVMVLPMEVTLRSEFHVDSFQHHFGVGAAMSDEEDSGKTSLGKGALDVVLCRDVNVIQLRFLDVVHTQFFVFVPHSVVLV